MAVDGRQGALTVTDIVPRTGFYDYDAKYARGRLEHVLPAELPAHVFENGDATCPSWRTPPLVAEALPDPTSVMTMLTTFWFFWRSTPSPA